MSLGLHEKCLNNLKEKLAAALEGAIVINKSYLDTCSLGGFLELEKSLPTSGKIKTNIESYITESPIFDFLYDQLSKELNENFEYDFDTPKARLLDIEEYSKCQEVSGRLINLFESLPWNYIFTFKLNQEISKFIDTQEFKLSKNIKIIKPNDQFTNSYPLKSGIAGRDRWLHGGGSLLGNSFPKEWDKDSAYIQIESTGFVGKLITTNPKYQAIDSFKSILGIAIAIGAFEVNYSYSFGTTKNRVYIHQNIADAWEITDSTELDEDASKTISDLIIGDSKWTLQTDEQKKAFINNRLSLLASALSKGSVTERLLLSGKWLFDSYCGKNELLSFVQTMVALEILLGDKAVSDLMGLGELLRNRCAYLIGKSHQEREEILGEFKKIYEIRSKIVHRGKGRLTRDERTLFHKLQRIVNRVIEEEIKLIGKNA